MRLKNITTRIVFRLAHSTLPFLLKNENCTCLLSKNKISRPINEPFLKSLKAKIKSMKKFMRMYVDETW